MPHVTLLHADGTTETANTWESVRVIERVVGLALYGDGKPGDFVSEDRQRFIREESPHRRAETIYYFEELP